MADIQSIVGQMTLEEKAALLTGANNWTTVPLDRLGIPAVFMADGPHGVRRAPEVNSLGALSPGNLLPHSLMSGIQLGCRIALGNR